MPELLDHHCPCCNSSTVLIRSGGRLLPFFVKRVFGIEPPTIDAFVPRPISIRFPWLTRLSSRLPWFGQARPLDCDILVCAACDFVCPAIYIADSQLLNLYHDYRSESYNTERTHYEPSYGKVAASVGKAPDEYRARIENVERFLNDVPGLSSVRTVLDFAGAEGRFIPPALQNCNCTVCDVSDEPVCRPEIRKTKELTHLGLFDYIQACHLFEHVRHPVGLLTSLVPHLALNGLLYIEVPKEGSVERVQRLRAGRDSFPIHEHINLFTEKSLAGLVEAAGLRLLKIASNELDLGWCRATNLSALATRMNS